MEGEEVDAPRFEAEVPFVDLLVARERFVVCFDGDEGVVESFADQLAEGFDVRTEASEFPAKLVAKNISVY